MKKIAILLLAILLCSCAPQNEYPIDPAFYFSMEKAEAISDWRKTLNETDECSSTWGCGWYADIFLDKNWADCCIDHDFDYREGSKYGVTKEQADYALWECVEASGHPVVANIIYDAVYLFGFMHYVNHGPDG
jgi:hypothetical protein